MTTYAIKFDRATDLEEGSTYQVTWELPNGVWEWSNLVGMSFQGACKEGLHGAPIRGAKLIRIEKIA